MLLVCVILFYFTFLFVFSVFYRSLEEKEAFLEILGIKDKSGKKLKFLLERSIAGDLRSSALALEHLSKDRACLRLRTPEGD